MATPLDIQGMAKFIQESSSAMDRALSLAQIVTIQKAQVLARQNAQVNFTGRNDRRLSGGIMNNLYAGYEQETGNRVPTAYLGVANIPYGAIHEFGSDGLPGGVIRPVKAKKLWIPARANAGRMTPGEFINLMRSQPSRYFITDHGAFLKEGEDTLVPLFYRVDQVKIPARPYIRPALALAYQDFADTFERFYQAELNRL